MGWWAWFVLGCALLAAELFVPTNFFLFFIGVGAVLTGCLEILGLASPFWMQLLICAVIISVLVITLRQKLMSAPPDAACPTDIIGQDVIVSETIAPGGQGSGELRGTTWTVKNDGSSILEAGTRYKVERVEGLVLFVRY